MPVFSNPGFWTGLVGVIAAVTALVRVIKLHATVTNNTKSLDAHVLDPGAHEPPPEPPKMIP